MEFGCSVLGCMPAGSFRGRMSRKRLFSSFTRCILLGFLEFQVGVIGSEVEVDSDLMRVQGALNPKP